MHVIRVDNFFNSCRMVLGCSFLSSWYHPSRFCFFLQQTELFTNLTEATPPRDDPVYNEMIGTLELHGTLYMSKEDMDFCAMRLYSKFKQGQDKAERHVILDSIDVSVLGGVDGCCLRLQNRSDVIRIA